jgi:hypothetical protein
MSEDGICYLCESDLDIHYEMYNTVKSRLMQ